MRLLAVYAPEAEWDWILAERGHGSHLRRVFGPITPDEVWEALIGQTPCGADFELEFHDNGEPAMLEIMEQDLDGLDRIVVAPLSKLRRIEPPTRS